MISKWKSIVKSVLWIDHDPLAYDKICDQVPLVHPKLEQDRSSKPGVGNDFLPETHHTLKVFYGIHAQAAPDPPTFSLER